MFNGRFRRHLSHFSPALLAGLLALAPGRASATAPDREGAPPLPPRPPRAPLAPLPPAPPLPPAAPMAPLPPMPPLPPEPDGCARCDDECDDADPWVLVEDRDSSSMHGSTRDLKRARRLSGGEPLLWFRRDGKEYVVRDAALLERVRRAVAPQQALGRKMGALGAEQGRLGAQQAALGGQQAALGMEQARQALAGRRDADDDESPPKPRRRRAVRDARAEELGEEQGELGRKQGELGREMGKLGREMKRVAREAEAQVAALVDESLKSGAAKPAP